MPLKDAIPVIDIEPLLGPNGPARKGVDERIKLASRSVGFMVVTGLPHPAPLGPPARERLLSIFDLPDEMKRRLYRRRDNPENSNLYRGFCPHDFASGPITDSMDVGPDAVDPARCEGGGDPLKEPTPWPAEELLPDWRRLVGAYYGSLEGIASALLRSIARSLGLPEDHFDPLFRGGNSTLSILRYPADTELPAAVKEARSTRTPGGEIRFVLARPHTDSGCITLVQQNGTEGLQARHHDGGWMSVPPIEGSLAVNFGNLLSVWTGNRVVATEHRVVGPGCVRHSLPFFFEPAVDAVLSPLPGVASELGPICYGDYLWERMQRFPDYRGLGPRRPSSVPSASNGSSQLNR